MIMVESKMKTIYEHCDGFGNDESFTKTLNNLSPETMEFINNNEIVKVYFTLKDDNNVFAWSTFHNSKLIDKGFNLRIAQGSIGVRETDQLINLPKDYYYLFLKALNEYFGKDRAKEDILKSVFKRRENLIFDIVRIEDGLHGKKLSLNASTFQLNICNVNKEIPQYLIERSYDAVEIPYTRVAVPYQIIYMALETLDLFYYSTLAVWFFPEREPRNAKGQQAEHRLKHSKSTANYKRSLRRKDKAIIALFDNIIYMQELEKQVNS